jgi:RHS repeat-associated protein
MVILILTSGPLYLPLVLASTQEASVQQAEIPITNSFLNVRNQYNETDETKPDFSDFKVIYNYTYSDPEQKDTEDAIKPQEQTYIVYHDRTPEKEPSIAFASNVKEGESPLYVTFKTQVENPDDLGGILLMKYDFDGDGYNDYATYENQPVTHVYTVEAETTLHPTVTVVYKNGCASSKSVDLVVHPVNPNKWFSIKRSGYTRFAINKNGTMVIYDERDWIRVALRKDGATLRNPNYTSFDDLNSRLTYDTNATILQVDIKYGLAGRAQLRFTEHAEDDKPVTETGAIYLPNVKSGRLDFTPAPFKVANQTTRTMTMDAGNHYPWTDQGLVPYGEYFKNENEYVSTQTGFLTVTQTDLYIPGRGVDISITRVHTPPAYFEGNQPATTDAYSYQDYPWAPMGKGWQLAFPWIETNNGAKAYIRFPNGQRYKYDGAGTSGTEYHSGDHFKLYGHTNGTYTLYTVDGARYDYDSNYRPTTIKDTCGNTISFTYNANNKITAITDTIGRTVSFSYNANGQVASVSSGNRTVNYSYASGAVSGYILTEATDPDGRKTKYTYNLDYLVTKVEYPTGGHTAYEYNVYDSSGYYQYRVRKQTTYDGKGSHTQRCFIYDTGFDYVDKTTIKESLQTMSTVKTTVMTYSQNTVTEEVYNGKESDPRMYKDVKTLSEDRRRIDIDHYPGNNANPVEMTQKYDSWGNLIFRRDYEDHDSYYSYSNTDSSGVFKDTNTQVHFFSDSFYSGSVTPNVHSLLLGAAEQQNGAGSGCIEQYNQYSFDGLLTQTKRLLNTSWVATSYTYDSHGNMVKVVNPESQTTYYEYGSAYSSAYLTATKEQLTDTKNITTSYAYYYSTGDLKQATDAYDNSTKYEYDVLGRITKLTNPETDGVTTYKTADYYDEVAFSGSPKKDVVTTDVTPDWFFTQTFNAEGRTWVFVYYNNYIRYYSSTDQDTWTSPRLCASEYMDHWNLYFDGEYVHLAYTKGEANADLYYERGNPNSDGTITWSGSYKAYDTGSLTAFRPSITVTDNYVWICFDKRAAETDKDPHVTCSTNMDGGWTTRTGFPTKMDDCTRNVYGKLAPLSNDKVYFAYSDRAAVEGYLWNGASWGSTESIDSVVSSYCTFDLASWGNDVWLFLHYGLSSFSWSKVRMRTYASGSWDSGTNMAWTDGRWWSMQLSKGPTYGTLYAWWQNDGTPYGIVYKYFDGATWGSKTTLETDSEADGSYGTVSSSDDTHEGKISLVYATGSATETYQFKHNYLPISKVASESSVRITDENGASVKRYYNGLSRLTRNERFNGSASYSDETYSYNVLGLVESYTDPTGNEYSYEYDALGLVKKTINPDDSYSQNNRYYAGYYDEVIDEEGRKKVLKYDSMQRLVEVDEYYQTSSYYATEYMYDEVGNLKILEDSLGRSTSYYYDQFNRPIHVQCPDSKWERYIYNDVDNVVNKFNRNGTCIQYEYDSLNRMVNETCYLTNITCSISEDETWLTGWEHRKTINITGTQAGSQINYQIMFEVYFGSGTDSSNRVYLGEGCQADFDDIRFTRSDGVTALDHWRGYHNANMAVFWVEVNSVPASPGSTTIYIYYGNPVASSASNGADTFKEFDDLESYTSGATLPFGDWIALDVQYTVQISTTRAWEGSKSIYAYDSGSLRNIFRWDIDDIESGSYRFHCAFYVESYGTLRTNPLTPVEVSRIVNVIYENGVVMYYDGSDHTICTGISADAWHTMEICFPVDGATFDLRLDGDWYNNLNQEHQNGDTDPRYAQVTCGGPTPTAKAYFDAYFIANYADPEPQITGYGGAEVPQQSIEYSKYWTNKLQSTLYEYDDLGNPMSSSYNGTTVEWRYDARNRLTRETFNVLGSVYTVNYGYDGVGNVVELVYPDSSALAMEYDFAGRAKAVGDYASLRYTLSDKINTLTFGNGVTTSYTYDERDRPENVVTRDGSTVLLDLTYTYDDSGSVTSIYDGSTTETYGYDLLDRLTSSSGPWGNLIYLYDYVGNRLSLNRGGVVTSYTYDSVDRIASATGMGFTWDDNGNLLMWDDGSDDWAYRYDPENRLINVEKNSAASARYTYDAGGRRVRSWGAAGTTDYVYSGFNVVDEIKGGAHEKHVYAGSMHIASVSSGTVEYFHVDHLGSTRLKTDASGNAIYESNYEPYGPEYGESGSEEFRYTGKQEDPTGLYYFGARYYDPVTGRFITRDSTFGDLSDPQSLNKYSYSKNNPHKYIDPDGKNPLIVAGFIAGALVSGGIYYYQTRDFKGAVIRGLIGGVAGAVAGATFGMAAWIMAPNAASMVAAAGSLGLKATMVAGAVSTVVGKGCEHTLTTTAHNAGLIEEEPESVSSEDVLVDATIGGLSGGTAKTIHYLTGIAGYFNPEIDLHVRQAEEALSRGENTPFVYAYELISAFLGSISEYKMSNDIYGGYHNR